MEKRSILYEMSQKTPTVLWNDSCSIRELTDSIEINNAVGATCNPTIVLTVLKKEWEIWKERIPQIIAEMPTASEDQIGWRVTEEMSPNASKLLSQCSNGIRARMGGSHLRRIPNSTGPRKRF